MRIKADMTLVAVLGLAFLTQAAAGTGSRRQLLDIRVNGTDTVSVNFTISAFGVSGVAGGNCFLTGYPGSRADSTVAGPLIVDVPFGNTSVITFGNAAQGSPPQSAIVFYDGGGNITQLLRAENASYGLISITFVSNSSDPEPQSASIVAGLVDGYPTTPANQSTCLVNVTFITAPPPPPPSPPPPLSTICTSQYPSNPCYCQGSYCFNFAGGSTNTNCFTPQGLTCVPTTLSNPVAAGFYNTAPGPVCNCTNSGTFG